MPQLVQRLDSEHVGDHPELRQALERGKEGETHDVGLGERRVRVMDLECGTAHGQRRVRGSENDTAHMSLSSMMLGWAAQG